ncbi:MAG TPA: hypothetical protein VEU32_13215 [Burkholderiales bacterium]|nr:hypothetical protein [Burkholderiales bacterium]
MPLLLPAKGGAIRSRLPAAKKANAEAMIVLPSGTSAAHGERLVRLAAENRLPTLWEHRQFINMSVAGDVALD